MFWWLSAAVVLPVGVVLLLFITLPLHKTWLRRPSQRLVQALLDIHFFDLKVLGAPVTVFHAILTLYGILFLGYLKPWGDQDHIDREGFHDKSSRWHNERNMYISAFIWVTYLMIFQYHNLRAKYDKLKEERDKAKKE
jgi:hypothetical protein